MKKWLPGLMILGMIFLLGGCKGLSKGPAEIGSPSGPVTFDTLCAEMTDMKHLAFFPEPAYQLKQASSYDRRSTSPLVLTEENWFANGDAAHFLRVELKGKDKEPEYVMMDHQGPGALVRFWSANPHSTIRIYLDGAEEPQFEADFSSLTRGLHPLAPLPISGQRALGCNLYLPIPYEKSCKVTVTSHNMYYHVNYRAYPEGTAVETMDFNRPDLEEKVKKVAELLKDPGALSPEMNGNSRVDVTEKILNANECMGWEARGEKAIQEIRFQVEAENLEAALRGCLLEMWFDGRERPYVVAPLGDFFGSGPGFNVGQSLPVGVQEDGWMYSRWYMPFQESALFRVTNYSGGQVKIKGRVSTVQAKWTPRSMYFHSKWKTDWNIPAFPRRDYSFLETRGRGVYVGNVYHVTNPRSSWWGEGDEKIWVDGEDFPSIFGTGTEDYYGYAWCWPVPFSHAYHAQPRADGPGNYGQICNSRYHVLDPIPFERSFQFDMELWHHQPKLTSPSLAVASFWYGDDCAYDNFPPVDTHKLTVPSLPTPMKVEGAIEGETAKILRCTGGEVDTDFFGKGYKQVNGQPYLHTISCLIGIWHGIAWSNYDGLWWQQARPGDELAVEVNAPQAGKYKLYYHGMRGEPYGIFDVILNGQQAPAPITLRMAGITITREIYLGEFDLKEGANELVFRCKNEPQAQQTYLMLLDYVRLEPVQP